MAPIKSSCVAGSDDDKFCNNYDEFAWLHLLPAALLDEWNIEYGPATNMMGPEAINRLREAGRMSIIIQYRIVKGDPALRGDKPGRVVAPLDNEGFPGYYLVYEGES